MATEYSNRQIDKPIVVVDVMNGQTIASLQPVFPLTKADFGCLKGGPPITYAVAVMVFSGVIGYAIGLGPKLESIVSGGQSQMSYAEFKTIAAWSGVALLIYFVGLCLPNERKSVMKKLSNYFKAAESSTSSIGGGK